MTVAGSQFGKLAASPVRQLLAFPTTVPGAAGGDARVCGGGLQIRGLMAEDDTTPYLQPSTDKRQPPPHPSAAPLFVGISPQNASVVLFPIAAAISGDTPPALGPHTGWRWATKRYEAVVK